MTDVRTLTPQQARAVDLLIDGSTIADAALELGVSRQTISGWANHHPAFIAELETRRRAIVDEQRDRMVNLRTHALDIIAELFDDPDNPSIRLKAAELILRLTDVTGHGSRTTPDQVIRDKARPVTDSTVTLLLGLEDEDATIDRILDSIEEADRRVPS